ncbi:TcaA second domain-containing protein [Oceanobacillus damuensis]|uniref:TcaA second domain-containing protein n=1 Tax=Oceanobacillus damuensis TaxID=937928 RepID=UPI000836B759|nr:hypothetical protein [Oceanobacillus damuensis]
MECTNCGYKLTGPKHYCPEYGTDLAEQYEARNIALKKKILFGSIIGIILIAFIVFYNIGSNRYNPELAISEFEEAVKNADISQLMNFLTPADESMEITEENIAAFLSYLEENPEVQEELLKKFKQQAANINSNESGNHASVYTDDMYATLNLTKQDKRWLVFDDYKMEVVPAFIYLYTNHENITLYINKEQVATTNNGEFEARFDPFMPGSYSLKAFFDNTYAKA